MTTFFRSKIDTWLLAVLIASMAASLLAAIAVIIVQSPGRWWIAAITTGIGLGLPLWLVLSTRYTLEDHQLTVQSGPFKWRILLADIIGIAPTRDPLSSPALSLDRLRIDYSSGRSLMISPRDQGAFLRAVDAARRGGAPEE